MRKIIIFLSVFLSTLSIQSQNFNFSTPLITLPSTGALLTTNIGNAPAPSGDATLLVEYIGDIDINGSEFYTISGENSYLFGNTPNGPQCGATFNSITYTIPQATLMAWTANGSIDLYAQASPSVNVLNCANGEGVKFTIDYPSNKGTNNAGVAQLISPLNFCPGSENISVSIINAGFNQINSVTIGWSLNGVLQTPITNNTLLDTAGGAGSSSATISLGTNNFIANQTVLLKAWTSNPNGVVDTVNNNDTLNLNLTPALSGSYTIGGASPDFATFGAAVNILNVSGICGPITFNVRSGTYPEQITIGNINGSSPNNTITFQGDTANTTIPEIVFNGTSANNFVWKINGGSYINVNGIGIINTNTTYSRVVDVLGSSSNINFFNDSLSAPVSNSTSNLRSVIYIDAGGSPSDISFDQCKISGGSYGAYLRGASTTTRMNNVSVTNSSITDFYYMGIYYWYGSGSVCSNNFIRNSGTYTFPYGLYYYYQDDAPQIVGNDYQYDSPSAGYSLYLAYIEGNANNRALIANNAILQLNTGATSTNYGIYCLAAGATDFYYNTVVHQSGNTSTRAFFYNGNAAYNDVNIMNNIFISLGSTQAVYINSTAASAITQMDYNCLYSNGSLGYYGTSNVANLQALQATSGMDANSVSVIPNFVSPTDLHLGLDPNLDGKALPLASVTKDIDLENRNLNFPDIGADEFRGPPNNAGVANVVYPANPLCGSIDNRVWMNLVNSGDSIIDSVIISYQVIRPGSPTPLPLRSITYYGSLLPGQVDSNVVLPTFQGGFQAGDTLYLYTSMPNGIPDSLSLDDTIMVRMINGFAGGHFTIGDTTSGAAMQADFPSFTAAANFLDSVQGICDSVIFDVIDSTFVEQLTINNILGTSPTSPIIFRGMNGANSTALLRFTTQVIDSNYTVWLNGGTHIIFENLTISNPGNSLSPPGGGVASPYGTVVKADGAHNSIFKNCAFGGSKTANTSSSLAVLKVSNTNGFWIDNSRINDGAFGVDLNGGSNTLITNNNFKNQFAQGASFTSSSGITFTGNIMNSNSGYVTPTTGGLLAAQLIFNNIAGGVDAHANTIYGSDQFPLYGVAFVGSQAKANRKNFLYNNFIGIGASYSGFDFGGVALINSDFTIVSNNNVAIEGNGNNASAFLADGGSQNEVYNNSFANFGAGKAVIFASPSTIISSDNNNLYSTGSSLGEYAGAAFPDLMTWSGLGYDVNSVSADPQYYKAPQDLHVCNLVLNGAGAQLPFIFGDIDNDPKDPSLPDIGADEFTPVAEFTLGADTGLCTGAVLNLTGGTNTGDLNVWSTGDSTLTLTVNTQGSYSINMFNECGIKADTINVTYQIPVNLNNDTNICAKQTISINAGISNVNYTWNTGQTTQSINVSAPGNYTIRVEDNFGCLSRDTITVTQSGLADISGLNVVCGNQTTFLEATPSNSSYNWSNGATNNIITVSNPGLFWVEVNDKGCLSKDTVIVTASQLSNADYTYVASYLTFAVTQNNSIGDDHLWNFGDGNTSTLKKPTHTYSAAGSYTVTYSVSNICDTASSQEEIRAIGVGVSNVTENNNILVYPNPTNGIININLIDLPNQTLQASLFDVKGAQVYGSTINVNSKNQIEILDLNKLSSGMYILKLVSNDYNFNQRIEIK